MADSWSGSAAPVRGMAELAGAVASAEPFDTVDLDAALFGDWRIGLADGQWILTGAAGTVQFGGASEARMRLRRHGFVHMLVGGNGHASVRAALDQAGGGEIILVAPGIYDEGEALVIDRPVTMQGVMHNGAAVTDSDSVAATVLACGAGGGDAAFVVEAPGVIIHGLGLTTGLPSEGSLDPSRCGRLLEIRAAGFSLLSSVIGTGASGLIASAIHCAGSGEREPRQHAFLSGNEIHGAITLEIAGPVPRAVVAIVGNRIEADLLPPVCVGCEARMLAGPDVAAVLPVLEDNIVHAAGGQRVAMALQWEQASEGFTPCSEALDLYFARLVHANPGIGAVVVDAAGHIRSTPLPDFTGSGRSVQGLAVYDSVQAAHEEVREGDAVHAGDDAALPILLDHTLRLRSAPAPRPAAFAGHPAANDGSVAPAEAGRPLHELSGMEILCVLHSGLDAVVRVRLFSGTGRLKRVCDGIQQAIEVAEDGDRIVVPAGRHVGDLRIGGQVAIMGANAGRPASSPRRGVETTIMGRVTVDRHASEVVIDGVAIVGSVEFEPAAMAGRRFELRNCIIDGRGCDTAITVQGGSGSAITNNLVLGGRDEAVRIPRGFDDLAISGNRIHAVAGGVGVALSGGPGNDSVQVLGNTFIGGDYGVLLEIDEGLAQPGDVVTIAGNHFGEVLAGVASGAPVIAAIHADGPVPAALEHSLGMSLERNTYHVAGPAVGADVLFQSPRSAGGYA